MLPLKDLLNTLLNLGQDNSYQYKRLYRELYNPEFYNSLRKELFNLYKTQESSSSKINLKVNHKIESLISSLKNQSYKPDKLKESDQEKFLIDNSILKALSILLETIYKPIFSQSIFGISYDKNYHSCLIEIKEKFTNINWFIVGSINSFYINIDQILLIKILEKRVKDDRFINLVRKFLKSNYLSNWNFNQSYSGIPKGNRLAWVLINIFLNELDSYILEDLKKEFKQKILESDQSKDRKKLLYVRYGDQFLIGVNGSKNESRNIIENISQFLSTQLNFPENSLDYKISHYNEPIFFLNYEIMIHLINEKIDYSSNTKNENKRVILKFPFKILKKYLKEKKVVKNFSEKQWKAQDRSYLINNSDIEILSIYNSELKSLYHYYSLANNINQRMKTILYFMEWSCLKTLARKHKSTVNKVRKKLITRQKNWGILNPETGKIIEFNKEFNLNKIKN